jgi:hypothetical protein
VVVVGGGWAGFGAAHALARARLDVDVTLLEASTAAGGLAAGWRSACGQPVEAGIHGFWRNYLNIDRLVGEELRLHPFTPYTPSALHTTSGLAVEAPVLGDLPRLPSPLGTALWPTFRTLSLAERATAASLLGAFADFDGTDAAWRRWDQTSARALFERVSPKLYEEFLEPMLLVLPMCPGEDCSAAAALSLFSFFALEHQADFDVRWLRASASEAIFKPWAEQLAAGCGLGAAGARDGVVAGGGGSVEIRYGKRLVNVIVEQPDASASTAPGAPAGPRARVTAVQCLDGERIPCDAVISAVGISAAQRIAQAPGLQALDCRGELDSLARLRAVDVVAVRLWTKRRLVPPCASNVCGARMAAGLEQVGFTFYDLNALQDDARGGPGGPRDGAGGHGGSRGGGPDGSTGGAAEGAGGGAGTDGGSLIEIDFYYARTLLEMDDDMVIATAIAALRRALPSVYGSLELQRDVRDSAVVRVPRAVSHFAPGCYEHLPQIESRALSNWFWAGDWVDRGGHRSWSQEKALVTGMQAAKAAARRVLGPGPSARVQVPLDVEPDEPHVQAARAVANALRGLGRGASNRAR